MLSSIMATHGDYCSFVQKCVFLTLFVAIYAAPKDVCRKEMCPGPLRFYKDLGCAPVYKDPDDCCAKEYDCSHLKNMSKGKCYVNDHEYSIGEKLRNEDANPCDVHCVCTANNGGTAGFVCAAVNCTFPEPPPNCYIRYLHDQCCPGPPVCLKEGERRATCEIDGKIYRDGEYFKPKSEPEKNCYCMPGYKGENVEPFCKKVNRKYCSPLFLNAPEIHKNCAPTFHDHQNPQRDCTGDFSCQKANGTIIHSHRMVKSLFSTEKHKTCQFGDTVMHIGDELYQETDDYSVCVKCVCELPPIPTCQRQPANECDVMQYEST